jgi:hypothetical protein
MRRLGPHLQSHLVEILLAPCLPQLLYLVIAQLLPNKILQLLLADPLMVLLLLVRFVARLEARLHANAERRVEAGVVCVAADFGTACFRRLVYGEVFLALGLEAEGTRVVGDGDDQEALFGRDGGCVGAENAVFVAAEISAKVSRCVWKVEIGVPTSRDGP